MEQILKAKQDYETEKNKEMCTPINVHEENERVVTDLKIKMAA